MIIYKQDKKINQENLAYLYNSVGWISYTQNLEKLEKAISQSLAVISAWDNDKLIGLIRGVGDGETILYIQDILIHPDYQNQGIGNTLMSTLLAIYPDVRQKVLLTEEAPNVRHFYEKFGFTSCDKGQAVAFYKEF